MAAIGPINVAKIAPKPIENASLKTSFPLRLGRLHHGIQVLHGWAVWRKGERDYGGESGIRTHGGCYTTHAFQACALSHSAISPAPRRYSTPPLARHGGTEAGVPLQRRVRLGQAPGAVEAVVGGLEL